MIKNIGIIGGSGKIGSTFKNAFESIGLNVLVTDHTTKDQEKRLIENSDWVILCVPIDKTVEVFDDIKKRLRKNQVFSDFTSVKSIIEVKKSDYEFISCHPLFGPLNNIEGQNIITIPVSSGSFYDEIKDIFIKIGLKVTEMKSLEEHDKYMSLIQGMTHFSHVCFTTAMKKLDLDLDKVMEICSPIYQSNISFSSRITGGDENLYTNIIMDNPTNIDVLQMYLDTSNKLLEMVKDQNYDDFKSNFKDNRDYLKNHISNMIDQSNFLIDKMAEFKKDFK
jgi:prephenate dehydrogenase